MWHLSATAGLLKKERAALLSRCENKKVLRKGGNSARSSFVTQTRSSEYALLSAATTSTKTIPQIAELCKFGVSLSCFLLLAPQAQQALSAVEAAGAKTTTAASAFSSPPHTIAGETDQNMLPLLKGRKQYLPYRQVSIGLPLL